MIGTAQIVQSWNELCIILGTLSISLIVIVLKTHESPRWLHVNGQTEEAEQVFKELGLKNGYHRDDQQRLNQCEKTARVF